MRAKIHTALFAGIHLSVLLTLVVDFRWSFVALAAALYVIRMFAITAGYHRLFAHRAYKTSRPMQLVLAVLGTMAVQKGPLWWASVHRAHHRYADKPKDAHSPRQRGMWHAHVGWILARENEQADLSLVEDLVRFPELRWLDRNFWVPPAALALALLAVGGTGALVWGFSVSTVVLWHATFAINSLAHTWGSRRYEVSDSSRNNGLLAVLTLGEGWHNNHHRYCSSARQGFFWWEVDMSYYALRALAVLHLVSALRPVPPQLLGANVSQELKGRRSSSRRNAPAVAGKPGVSDPWEGEVLVP